MWFKKLLFSSKLLLTPFFCCIGWLLKEKSESKQEGYKVNFKLEFERFENNYCTFIFLLKPYYTGFFGTFLNKNSLDSSNEINPFCLLVLNFL